MSDNANQPAMPIEINGFGQYAPMAYTGLTKREHFAAMAMQGLLSKNMSSVKLQDKAKLAVEYADALLYELDKQEY